MLTVVKNNKKKVSKTYRSKNCIYISMKLSKKLAMLHLGFREICFFEKNGWKKGFSSITTWNALLYTYRKRMISCFPLFPDCFMTFSWFLMFHGALFCIYPSLILWDLCFQTESNWNPMVMSWCWSVLMNRLSQIMMVKSKTKTVFLLFSKYIK